ncbi:MAG: class I SAM-dependent methyltransferase [bacterium]
MEDAAQVRGFFDKVGPWFYEFFFTLLGYRASLRHFSRLNYPHLGLDRGARVLDAGIGSGFLTANLLRETPVRFTVTGLDFSLGMWIALKRWLRRLNLENQVKFYLGDMRAMPFRNASFDLVVSSAAMEYLPEVDKGIAECCRVLRPGGRLLVITTRRTFIGKLIALLWRNATLEPARMAQHMRDGGIHHVKRLRFPWYFPHVNWWGMVLLGEKAEDPDENMPRNVGKTPGTASATPGKKGRLLRVSAARPQAI